jgi:cell pole-organizing protein PopZ
VAEALGMSAVNASMGDREHEAVRRAQRAHEPSMEEILASIRTIIAEEREPAQVLGSQVLGSQVLGSRSASEKPAAPAPGPQVVYSKAEPAAPARRLEPAAEMGAPKVVWRQPEPEADRASEPPLEGPAEDDAPLLSPETDQAVASAFEALSANLAARTEELAGGLAREMLRPMLKAWLDENLPAIVERLVRAEIERIVRAPH